MKKYGLMPTDILLPEKDFNKWAVVACDQFTSEADYWNETESIVGDFPSTLRVTLPEIYLDDNREKRIESINKTMTEYLENGVLKEYKNAMIYVERVQSDGKVRHGIVGAIDLNDYDYKSGTNALIRATEQTVVERIPPRVSIRRDAAIELPHVLLLANDVERTVIEPLKSQTDKMTKAYDFDLMQNGGHITGWFLNEAQIEQVGNSVNNLLNNGNDLMFAVGDGNHSLATAKECSLLSDSEKAKSALVEVVNVHDEAIAFEPIYRVLFNVEPKKVIDDMKKALDCDYTGSDAQRFICVFGTETIALNVRPTAKLAVGTLQKWLDEYIKDTEIKIDYIHGEDVVYNLCKEENRIGFIFDGMKKEELFAAIKADGSLPRKTFSMGHAYDKRYYIEARKIK